jgi:hypothetical protein
MVLVLVRPARLLIVRIPPAASSAFPASTD